MKFYGGVLGGKRNTCDPAISHDPDHHADFQLEIRPFLNKVGVDFDEIFRTALQ